MSHKPSDYIAIKLWHQNTGSMSYYWENLQNEAAATNAPLGAIYKGFTSKRWMTVDELSADHPFRAALEQELKKGS